MLRGYLKKILYEAISTGDSALSQEATPCHQFSCVFDFLPASDCCLLCWGFVARPNPFVILFPFHGTLWIRVGPSRLSPRVLRASPFPLPGSVPL